MNLRHTQTRIGFLTSLFFLLFHPTYGQRDFDTVTIRSQKLSDAVWMLAGSGGNIGVSAGEDGIFMIDDQFAPLTEKIKSAIAEIAGSRAPVRFLMNTHWHGDHTGGN